ncbi:MAG TPA: hypothetical protein VMU16_11995 [Candidatus Binataceae bacterium]|nr:hypothetical protein [Candidatus Binataceae bacterium]
MTRITTMLLGAAMLLAAAASSASADPIRIGVGVAGPISPDAEADIEELVRGLPNVKVIPIQPPGDVAACVKRFVAGDESRRLDAVMIVSLPEESFKSTHDSNEANFTGSYEIWTLNLSTLAEDRHRFTFNDTEPVVGGAAAFLSMPAQLFAERATGKQLISTNQWQAYEAVQARVEAKLVAATRIYLDGASIRDIGHLVPLDTAKALLDRGDGETAMLVFKSAGLNNPEVQRMVANAQEQLKHSQAQALLGRAIGAIAGGNAGQARTILNQYEQAPTSSAATAGSVRRILADIPERPAETALDNGLRGEIVALNHSAFVAMLSQMFADETGAKPEDVIVSQSDVTIEDKGAPQGLKDSIDTYAVALGRSAWLMSLKCGCAAAASLTSEAVGATLLKARFAPSFKRPQVGLP